jgi:hypothetical protein
LSAITLATPNDLAVATFSRPVKSGQPTKSLSSYIFGIVLADDLLL